jgi:hypothetical protein
MFEKSLLLLEQRGFPMAGDSKSTFQMKDLPAFTGTPFNPRLMLKARRPAEYTLSVGDRIAQS